MSQAILSVFEQCKREGRTALVAYTMAGFRTRDETVRTMLALEKGGADILELGIPFTDPIADGPTIQQANTEALKHLISLKDCLQFVREARAQGLKAPIILMGYYNPILIYGERKVAQDAKEAGANGFIVVDLPPEEAVDFCAFLREAHLSYIPLVCPTTSDARIRKLSSLADSFIYCVSINGITGARQSLPPHLESFISRIRGVAPKHPLAVGFGISNHDQFLTVGRLSEGVVIGSAFVRAIQGAEPGLQDVAARLLAAEVVHGKEGPHKMGDSPDTRTRAEPGAAVEAHSS